ncbi:GGDEF domain-containing protein [Haloechinothrix halophila]|uniref:GGDEF domain-containing protein n=1 Tax=Haloechinothrix halophila TaxID=1069073 RepID=UPI000406A3B5|nr:GGDEF domain-containing protein [Haloechinothrix halophila]
MAGFSDSVRFAFQPLYSLHTGDAVAVEALAGTSGPTPQEILRHAREQGRLVETDIALAATAVEQEAATPTLLPLHVNLLATAIAADQISLRPLLDALERAGRRTSQVVIELGPPFTQADPNRLITAVSWLRELGFQVAFDGLGAGDLPLGLLSAAPVDILKLDRSVVRALPGGTTSAALVRALLHVGSHTGARLVATGVRTEDEFAAARDAGLRILQGPLLDADAGSLTARTVLCATRQENAALSSFGIPTVADFVRPAVTLPADATCDDARNALAADDQPHALVGLDHHGRPEWTVDKSRFLLALSGRYGHALHATKPAATFADTPHTVPAGAGALDLLDVVAAAEANRMHDDIVVIGRDGVCLGIVRVAEVVRGVAEATVEEAASLHPITGLPSSATIAKDVERRIIAGEPFIAASLDIDEFKQVNAQVGYAAGDELIRSLGETLTDLAAQLPKMTVSHVGGDDFLIAADMDEIGTLAPALLDTPWTVENMTVSVTLAGLTCAPGTVTSYQEVSRELARLKQRAKSIGGTSWVLGRPGVDRVDVLRGRAATGAA